MPAGHLLLDNLCFLTYRVRTDGNRRLFRNPLAGQWKPIEIANRQSGNLSSRTLTIRVAIADSPRQRRRFENDAISWVAGLVLVAFSVTTEPFE